ncbi:MAG: SCO family protein [Verrucomicrobiota bacterium]
MKSQARMVHWFVWGFLGFVILSIAAVFFSSLLLQRARPLPSYGDVPSFHLLDQSGRPFSLTDLQGKIWVADLIFTRCSGPCLEMTRQMKAIEEALSNDARFALVSLTADPTYDTPAVLQEYARRFGVNGGNWHFLTGSKDEIYALATKGLKLAFQDNPDPKPSEDALIHSTRFVLVDGRGQLRSVSFDGTEPGTVAKVVAAAERLAREK